MIGMILGIDLSERNTVASWGDIAKNQVKFVYLKCSDGLSTIASNFLGYKNSAKQSGILTGAYHWLNPKQDAQAQVDFFLKYAAIVADDLPPVVCLESYSTSKTVLEPKLHLFLEAVEERTGKRPIIYTSANYWKKNMSGVEWPCEYPLWIDEPGTSWPTQLFLWAGWFLWQFSYQAKVPSITGTPGLNWFNGDQEDLKLFTNQGLIKR